MLQSHYAILTRAHNATAALRAIDADELAGAMRGMSDGPDLHACRVVLTAVRRIEEIDSGRREYAAALSKVMG